MKLFIFILFLLAVEVIRGEDSLSVTIPREVGGSPGKVSALENADSNALLQALNETGGPGGTLGQINTNVEGGLPGYRVHSNCSNWEYNKTIVLPNGRFRHESAVFHTENDPPEVRYAGFLGDRFVARPYVVTYWSGYGDTVLTKPEYSCKLLPWGVLQCDTCVVTHFIFQDQPTVGCQDVPQEIEPTILPLSGPQLLSIKTSGNANRKFRKLTRPQPGRWYPFYHLLRVPDPFNQVFMDTGVLGDPENVWNGDTLEKKVGVPEKPIAPEKGKEELAKLDIEPLLLHFGGAPG